MSAGEREETGELLKRIVGDRIIVVIEHDLEFLRRYADFVTVMHIGKVFAEGTTGARWFCPARPNRKFRLDV